MKDEDFISLLEKYRHEFYRFVRRNLWNANDVEEIFSAAVMTAYENLQKFNEGTNFRAWMYRILINKCFVANRETQRNAVDIESVDDYFWLEKQSLYEKSQENPEWFIEECGDEVVKAISALSTMQRSCFLLLALAKYSYKEIGEILGIPVGTVMTHLSRGRARLRKALLGYAQDNGILPKHKNNSSSQRRLLNGQK